MNAMQQKQALRWILQLLQQQQVPYMLCGGLAAVVYGATRPVHDIDLFVADTHFLQVAEAGTTYISKPPRRYCEEAEGWDLEYLQFLYAGTKIEVGNIDKTKIYDIQAGQWVCLQADLAERRSATVWDTEVCVMPKAALVAYKQQLGRPVDLQDIAEIAE